MIYTLTPEPSIDYVMHSDIILGKTNRSTCEEIYPGGKGINVSLVLKELGMESIALGIEGGFTGKQLLKMLEGKIKTDFVHTEQNITRINVKIKGNTETEINGKGIGLESPHVFIPKLKNLQEGDWLIMSGSCLNKNMYAEIMKNLPKGVKTVLDTTPPALKEAIVYKPFLIKPNYDELCGYFGKDIDDVAEYGKILRTHGAENVLISLGDKGAVFVGEKVFRLPALKGNVINTVGAGDSMTAGFVYKYIKTGDMYSAFRMAVACGCAAAFGKWLPYKEDMEKNYDKFSLPNGKNECN